MALKAHALIKSETLKDLLTIEGSEEDKKFEILINMVSKLMINEIGHNPVYTTYTSAKFDGSGTPSLWLDHFPVVSISSLKENGITLTKDTDFVIGRMGRIVRIAGTVSDGYTESNWAKGNQNIEVTYKAGYYIETDPEDGAEEMPDDLQMACVKQVGIENKRFGAEDWDRTSMSFPDGSYAKNIVELHPQVKDICHNYRRPPI